MSKYTLFCIIARASASAPFPIDIEKDQTVGDLKVDIQAMNPNKLGSFDPVAFTLYRIDHGNETKLNPMLTLSKVFGPSGPPEAEETAHILVRLPEASDDILPKGIKRVAPEPLGPETPPKQPKIVHDAHDTLMNQISLIHQAIQALRPEINLSDPNTFTYLPFPSPLWTTKRFAISPNEDSVKRFQFMGRFLFQDLLTAIADPRFLDGSDAVYLYGPTGIGKSHLLAALVCHLIRDGARVVFIPDCLSLLRDPPGIIRRALLFAFHDNPDLLDEIVRAVSMADLIQFVKQRADHSIYIVVDQRNALDIGGLTESMAVKKADAFDAIDNLRAFQRYIFSATANERSDRERDARQSNINYVESYTGLNEVEARSWFSHYAASLPMLSEKNRIFIKGVTGHIPLLLQPLLEMETFDEDTFLESKEINILKTHVTTFFETVLNKGDVRAQCLNVIEAILLEQPLIARKDLYDMRYFFFDEKNIGHSTCAIASTTLMALYRALGGDPST